MKVTFFSGVAMAAIAADTANATSLSTTEGEITLRQMAAPATAIKTELQLSQQATTTMETDPDSNDLAEVESFGSEDSDDLVLLSESGSESEVSDFEDED